MKRKILSISLGSLAGVLFLALWLKLVDTSVVLEHLRELRFEPVLLAIVFYLSAYFFRSLRWRQLLKNVVQISPLRAFIVLLGGNFTNYLIPLRAGELAKCYFIKRLTGVRMSESLPSVFIDKLFDTLGIVLVFALIPLMTVNLPATVYVMLIMIVVILLAGTLIILTAAMAEEKVARFLQKGLFFVPKRYHEKLKEMIGLFVSGLAVFKHRRSILPSVLVFSLAAIACDSLFFYLLFTAFNVQVSYFVVLVGYTMIYLSYIIPHPPAQIGSNELMMVLVFAVGFGMNRDMVSAIMVFSHFLTGLLIIVTGMIAYGYAGIKLFKIFTKGEELYE
jgi:glycosyltransferase 2 family protein